MNEALVIDCCGTDGAGKTTALKYLISELRDRGFKVLETREVGCPMIPTCVKLRELVLNPESDMCGEAMELIFAAMRIENQRYYAKVSKEYDFIVSDRGWLSHLAYNDHNVDEMHTEDFYIKFVAKYTKLPDTVVYLDVDTETALQRRVKRGTGMDVIEMKGVAFQELVRGSFHKYLKVYENQFEQHIIDANEDQQGVRDQIDNVITWLETQLEGRRLSREVTT